jgi:superfamily II DNA or RNA helicase
LIEIKKQNESFLKITGDFEDLQCISEYFTKSAPNFIWNPKYKAGIWDGKIRFFNLTTGLLPIGLRSMLDEVISIHKLEFVYDNSFDYDIPWIDTFVWNRVLDEFKKYVPYEHQIEGAKIAITNRRGLLEHATSSGKTLTLFLILKYFMIARPEDKITVIVPSIGLIQQFVSDFELYGMSRKELGKYYKDEKDLTKRITVGTWQSLKNVPKFLETVNIVISDEVHTAKALEIKGVFEKCNNAKIRIGVTGSLPKEICDKLTIIGNFGPVLHTIKSDELIKLGFISPIDVVQINYFYPKNINKSCSKDYQLEKDIIQNDRRRMLIVRKLIDITMDNENILLLFDELEFGKRYYEFLKAEFPWKTFYYVDGDVDVKTRESIRISATENGNVVTIASLGTFSVGINIPRLHAIIGLWLGKSDIRLKQAIGRGLRKHVTKAKLTFYDICDQLKYSKDHAKERLMVYMQEGFPVKTLEVGKFRLMELDIL